MRVLNVLAWWTVTIAYTARDIASDIWTSLRSASNDR